MINLNEVGARASQDAGGNWQINFGIYLPGITFNKGYRLKLRIIHEFDQFVRGIEPADFWMSWENGSELDLWTASVSLQPNTASRFGETGRYLYRYQLLRGEQEVTFWFADPFGPESGVGTLSSVTVEPDQQPFPWLDAVFQVPEVDQMVVYELNVREFNRDFDGVILQLDYLWDLGVNVLELMPVTNVKEDVEWGYTPLGYFAPDERLGGIDGLKRLVNACHVRGIAVILDAVYAHAHPEFAYSQIYKHSGEPNPMMGNFAGEFFNDNPGADYTKPFTRDFFFVLNQYYLEHYHVDGFRYDYVPGMYDGFMGQGYAQLVFRTYEHSRSISRFAAPNRSKIIQCAEHLPAPQEILSKTYTNTCWQNGLLDLSGNTARNHFVNASFAHQLDPQMNGYPSEYHYESSGDRFPVAPFQYLESHDHARFINSFGAGAVRDLLGEAYGDRGDFYKMQPFIIAFYTAKGIPMLWQGQEFGENWGVPGGGIGRNLFERPLHWEYFYDGPGKALVRLHRILGKLRRETQALTSRGYFYYYFESDHLNKQVIAFRRNSMDGLPGASAMIAINFSNQTQQIWLPFPETGIWKEHIDGHHSPVEVNSDNEWLPINVPGNYGAIFLKT
ncbi:alpha-amylase family glycosyl hydrolase [Dyadobacter sp. CY326]|uniref:alpha-amylase family glycosyl hydrolase n=1 Tax=Dyadobacter sp. CY326 TaxID=2907300 RepID=UPI001F2C0A63|nr:alpha-amylase family glycosyl hydrolase [Dyadobacter sp. CY326]MCE7064973.1 alpha amylase C-terminal domain-containing protein [Dyadobacter sp. CY326]